MNPVVSAILAAALFAVAYVCLCEGDRVAGHESAFYTPRLVAWYYETILYKTSIPLRGFVAALVGFALACNSCASLVRR